MTNQELKRNTFLEANQKRLAKQEALYARFPEQRLYDEGLIGWNEYLKRNKESKAKEREMYAGNANYELYDDGMITWEDFMELENL